MDRKSLSGQSAKNQSKKEIAETINLDANLVETGTSGVESSSEPTNLLETSDSVNDMSVTHSGMRKGHLLDYNGNMQPEISPLSQSQPISTLQLDEEDSSFASTECLSDLKISRMANFSPLNPLASTFTPSKSRCLSSPNSFSTSTGHTDFSMDPFSSSMNAFCSFTNPFDLNLYTPLTDSFGSPMDAISPSKNCFNNTSMNYFPNSFCSPVHSFDPPTHASNISVETCSSENSSSPSPFSPTDHSIDSFTLLTSTSDPTVNFLSQLTDSLRSSVNYFGSSTDPFESSMNVCDTSNALDFSKPLNECKSRKSFPNVQEQPSTPTSSKLGLHVLEKANELESTKVAKKSKMRISTESRLKVHKVNTKTMESEKSKTEVASITNKTTVTNSTRKKVSEKEPGIRILPNDDQFPIRLQGSCKKCEKVYKADALKRGKIDLPNYTCLDYTCLKSKPGFIDTHCHLDFLFQRQNHGGTHTEYIGRRKDTYPPNYEGCLTVFCNPFSFQQVEVCQKYLDEEGVWGAFGCHPHNAKYYDDSREAELCYALGHRKVRALGEIGLDYSNRNDCPRDKQYEVMRRQLQIAKSLGLPLVIHCRDANDDCMEIMKKIVPRDYAIHLHCFTDGWDCAQEWLEEFPNLLIGVTNLVTYGSAKPTHDVVKRISLKRLLLETDAPYFVPRKGPKARFSHPGMAIYVASQIAALRKMPLAEVLHWTRQNTFKLYGI